MACWKVILSFFEAAKEVEGVSKELTGQSSRRVPHVRLARLR